MVKMLRVIVADMIAGGMRVRAEAGCRDRIENGGRRDPFSVVGHVDAATHEIEIQREDAGARERVADQRRFIGAVHTCDV
jgi:hypothetical protein